MACWPQAPGLQLRVQPRNFTEFPFSCLVGSTIWGYCRDITRRMSTSSDISPICFPGSVHRAIADFMIQSGDPTGSGIGADSVQQSLRNADAKRTLILVDGNGTTHLVLSASDREELGIKTADQARRKFSREFSEMVRPPLSGRTIAHQLLCFTKLFGGQRGPQTIKCGTSMSRLRNQSVARRARKTKWR